MATAGSTHQQPQSPLAPPLPNPRSAHEHPHAGTRTGDELDVKKEMRSSKHFVN